MVSDSIYFDNDQRFVAIVEHDGRDSSRRVRSCQHHDVRG